jgi:protein-S-isoprenylcysteine O-methyltransferase Ste14
MNIRLILNYVVILFPLSEIALFLFKRSGKSLSSKMDRGSSWVLWITITVSISVTIILQRYNIAVIQLPRLIINVIALFFLVGGLIFRWIAIISLGKFFTVDVAIHEEHVLVQRGLYKYVRHPSYTGLLCEFIGLGIYFGTWVSLIIIVVPFTFAIIYRIRCEEAVLLEKFAKQYKDYKASTKSLIPGIV